MLYLVGEWLSFAKFMYKCQIFIISSLPNINWFKNTFSQLGKFIDLTDCDLRENGLKTGLELV